MRFDVQFMDLKERQGFTQDEFVAPDVHETEKCGQEEVDEKTEDFGPDNE
jgi:hypothetical protein